MKKISVVTSCFNNEDTISKLYEALCRIFNQYSSKYEFEVIFVDDSSTDFTQDELRKLAEEDSRVKVIINSRNFGRIKSSYYGIMQAAGDAAVYIAPNLQDPPELISDFIENWEQGCEVVAARKCDKREFSFLNLLRKFYYFSLELLKDEGSTLIRNYTGFGLYDKKVINKLKKVNDPYPYFRGAVLDMGYRMKIIDFKQPDSNSADDNIRLVELWDNGMLGLTRSTKVPIHIITMFGFFGTIITFLLIILSLIFYVGYIDFVIPKKMLSLYFLMFIQILSVGLVGEYVIMLCRFAEKKPLVIEQERINF